MTLIQYEGCGDVVAAILPLGSSKKIAVGIWAPIREISSYLADVTPNKININYINQLAEVTFVASLVSHLMPARARHEG